MTRHRLSTAAKHQGIGFLVCLLMFVPGSTAMAEDHWDPDLNEQLVRRYYRAINEGELDTADQILTANFVKYNNGKMPEAAGPDVLKQAIRGHQERNSVYGFLIEDMIFAEDKAVVRWRWKSTNIECDAPREVTSHGISIFRIEGEKIAELWQSFSWE